MSGQDDMRRLAFLLRQTEPFNQARDGKELAAQVGAFLWSHRHGDIVTGSEWMDDERKIAGIM